MIDIIQCFLIHLFCSLMTSMEHNALQFLSNFNVWDYHFMHHFFTFSCLLIAALFGKIQKQLVSWKAVAPVGVTRLLSTIGINMLVDGSREGKLFMLRCTDCLLTFFVLAILANVFGLKKKQPRHRAMLVVPLAMLSSMSWFYPLTWDVHMSALIALPLTIIAGGLHNIFTYNQFQKLNVSFEVYLLNVSGFASALLLIPMVLNRIFCFSCTESANDELQFEFVDYAIFIGALVTMTGLIYTQYLMMCHCHPVDYLVLRHFKYTLAAAGQQVTQSFMHANAVNVTAQLISIAVNFCNGNCQDSTGLDEDSRRTCRSRMVLKISWWRAIAETRKRQKTTQGKQL
uniref:Sugar phosphate transporter domain-containing protein n=1 Tax=Trichuris muris TaxID=70415 RepID=A0A5S6Q9G2_TRIMR